MAIRRVPVALPDRSLIAWRALSYSFSICCALGSSSMPASVRVTCRAIRSNNFWPILDSNSAMRLLIVDWVTSSKFAASENDLLSATAINAFRF